MCVFKVKGQKAERHRGDNDTFLIEMYQAQFPLNLEQHFVYD